MELAVNDILVIQWGARGGRKHRVHILVRGPCRQFLLGLLGLVLRQRRYGRR